MPLKAELQPSNAIDHVHTGILQTPFHSRTSALNINQAWANWNGYASALSFHDEHIEYFATRNTTAVFDVSPMRKYRFTGADAEAMLNRMVTRDVSKQKVDTVAYNVWCTDAGRVIDDGTLFRLADDDFMLCCADPCLDWFLLAAVGFNDVSISDISDDIASLALQGPTSCALLKALGFDGIDNCKPFQIVRFPFGSGELMISRTGYTGDLGYELWVDPADAVALWDALFSTGELYGIQPMGEDSLDMARLEAGFIAPDVEFHGALGTVNRHHDHSPFELGLSWIVNFKKGHFTGREALLKQKESGEHRHLLRLDIEGNKPAEHSILYAGENCEKEIGYVTSAMWSPVVKANIAYGLVEAKYVKGPIWAEIYHQKELRWVRKVARCTVVNRPFWAPDRAKATPPPDC
ncbi:aminomethyltransferase [Halioglobus japonicus]|uniref:Aminomethyl transferase family protein n=1 Tax=Halioglobus japonicus TaxID=930805 RepID=A0AAP8MF22_9GAMM|nr:aminomethyltransferase family protein [Halioglobus japonicus]AQA18640.1 aminomethyltransferase [Halioglobus japonicus]PLW86666.1 aminomethyl transferase family protein [Halioglobus japonicus]GHD11677.1 glycine cleavage system protein T [Halioglobus japonicus]